jgi:hypothetical protein
MPDARPSSVETFLEHAVGFCNWCEGESLGAHPKVMAAVWLARLHAAALLLLEAEPENEYGLPDLPSAPLKQAERNLAPFAGWYYRTVFDPDPSNTEEPVMGDVGDDLLDTYKDVRAGCLLYERGQHSDALWHWSFLHRIHWSKHAVGALAALQGAAQRGQPDGA